MNNATIVFHTAELIELQLLSTSKGNQRKWYDARRHLYIKEQFRYQGKNWRDDLVEVIAGTIASQMNTKTVRVVDQHLCRIEDFGALTYGVFSEDFSGGCRRFVSFQHLLELKGKHYEMTRDVEKNWNFVVKEMNSLSSEDCTDYLIVMSLLDYMVGNEDRHLSNFGLMSDGKTFVPAPLFDFGLGLFEHDRKYEGRPFRECLALMQSKPFSHDNQKVLDYLRDRYHLSEFLPKSIHLNGVTIPSAKAGSYLRNRCKRLDIELIGVD